MDSWIFWFLPLLTLAQYPQAVGDGLDDVTRQRMELRAKLQEQERIRLEQERIRLEQEVEQLAPMQTGVSWGRLHWSPLQSWQGWAFAGLLLLLLAAWFMWRKRSYEAGISAEEEETEQEEEDETRPYDLRWLLEERIQWPAQDLQAGCNRTMALINNLTTVLRRALEMTFYPTLQQAIGFGSAFEGWSASKEEVVYHMLVPLTPPLGHTFQLRHYTDPRWPGRNFGIYVELECSCPRDQQGANMLCFRHHADVIRMITGQPNLLNTLCTNSYLCVKKTARWFSTLVRASWRRLPQSCSWHLELLPSTRCCHLRLTNNQESFQVKLLFGVQRQRSDIFISSRARGAHTPCIMWPETYSVAETKFFRHMASQVPQDSSHLKCLQLLSTALVHKDFPFHSIKTIVMHLLNTRPVAEWQRKNFLFQLSDTLEQLRLSLERKHQEHFILGNKRLPEEIRLPRDVKRARPLNLLYGLAQDPAAHSQAVQAYHDLRQRLARVLAYGHC